MRNIEMYLNLLQLSLSLFVPVLQHPITSLDTKTKSADYRVNWQPKLMERGKDVRERRKETILNAYLIFVANATNGVSVKILK